MNNLDWILLSIVLPVAVVYARWKYKQAITKKYFSRKPENGERNLQMSLLRAYTRKSELERGK